MSELVRLLDRAFIVSASDEGGVYLGDMSAKAALAEMDALKEFWQAWAAKRLKISRTQWLRAAKRALDGDMRELRNRVELAEAEPVAITLSEGDGKGER